MKKFQIKGLVWVPKEINLEDNNTIKSRQLEVRRNVQLTPDGEILDKVLFSHLQYQGEKALRICYAGEILEETPEGYLVHDSKINREFVMEEMGIPRCGGNISSDVFNKIIRISLATLLNNFSEKFHSA